MSLLGKYRKETDKEEVEEDEIPEKTTVRKTKKKPEEKAPIPDKMKTTEAVPNSERRSPIISFSVATDLRDSLQAVREEYAINLSMWVERRLREAIIEHYPKIAEKYFE
ncbi:MAG: hypothetical protein BAJATHORv1_20428 [Candidatus Thorarchaeota archaeon]|nr:MAG: hypothetical protein BAJATHORv1_20428 [Candidatus Thorarchaeota archaeon]